MQVLPPDARQLVFAVHVERRRRSIVGPRVQVPSGVVNITPILARHCAVRPFQQADVVVAVGIIAGIGYL